MLGLFKCSMSNLPRGHQAGQQGEWEACQEVLKRRDFPRLQRQESGEPRIFVRRAILTHLKLSATLRERGHAERSTQLCIESGESTQGRLVKVACTFMQSDLSLWSLMGPSLPRKTQSEKWQMFIYYCVSAA